MRPTWWAKKYTIRIVCVSMAKDEHSAVQEGSMQVVSRPVPSELKLEGTRFSC